MQGVRIARVLACLCLALFAFSLLFRWLLYAYIPVASGEPYGLADVIEFALGWLLIGGVSISVAVALILAVKGPQENRVAAAWVIALASSVVALAQPLYLLAARWSVP